MNKQRETVAKMASKKLDVKSHKSNNKVNHKKLSNAIAYKFLLLLPIWNSIFQYIQGFWLTQLILFRSISFIITIIVCLITGMRLPMLYEFLFKDIRSALTPSRALPSLYLSVEQISCRILADFVQKGPERGRTSKKFVLLLLSSLILGNSKKCCTFPARID